MVVRMLFIFFVVSSLGKQRKKNDVFQAEVFCLEKSRLIRLDRDGEAVIVEVFHGNSLLLKCSYCDEENNLESRVWFYWNLTTSETKELETDDRMKITPLNSLLIQNVSNEDAGFYICRLPYDDTIQTSFNFLVDSQILLPNEFSWKGDLSHWVNYSTYHLAPVNREISSLELGTVKFEVFSGWSDWTACETCKDNPIKQRTAHCRVKPTPNTAAALPCRGSLIQNLVPEISSIVHLIPDFIQEAACEPVCSHKGVRGRKQLRLIEGGHAVVSCRGIEVGDKPRWEHNRRRINSLSEDGTAAVDRFGVLHLVGVADSSKGNYTCFSSENSRIFELNVVILSSNDWGLGKEFQRHAFYLAIVTFIIIWIFSVVNFGLYWSKKQKLKKLSYLGEDAQQPLLQDEESEF